MRKIISIIIILLLISGCSFLFNNKERISKNIELDLDECKIEKEKDTHGGFLGDGDYFAKLKCSSINYNELSNNWKTLPLSEQINKAIEIKQCDDNGCKNLYEKFSIPNIKNGYYYFLDRHSESKDKFDDSELNNRSSWNFTLAIIDKDTNIIYYYVLDT